MSTQLSAQMALDVESSACGRGYLSQAAGVSRKHGLPGTTQATEGTARQLDLTCPSRLPDHTGAR